MFARSSQPSTNQDETSSNRKQLASDIPANKLRRCKLSEMSTVAHTGPKLRGSARIRIASCGTDSTSTRKIDVQSSLIQLLTYDSPTKSKECPRDASLASHRSPRRRFFPFALNRQRSNQRTLASEHSQSSNSSFRNGNDSVNAFQDFRAEQKSCRRLNSFPLPTKPAWEELLEVAEAVEAYDSFDINSSSEVSDVTLDCSQSSNRDLFNDRGGPCDTSVRNYRNDVRQCSFWSKSSLQCRENHSVPFDSELKLELIENELKLLQEKLRQERNSKKLLEEEVSSLRRNNTLLLEQVRGFNPHFSNVFTESSQQSLS